MAAAGARRGAPAPLVPRVPRPRVHARDARRRRVEPDRGDEAVRARRDDGLPRHGLPRPSRASRPRASGPFRARGRRRACGRGRGPRSRPASLRFSSSAACDGGTAGTAGVAPGGGFCSCGRGGTAGWAGVARSCSVRRLPFLRSSSCAGGATAARPAGRRGRPRGCRRRRGCTAGARPASARGPAQVCGAGGRRGLGVGAARGRRRCRRLTACPGSRRAASAQVGRLIGIARGALTVVLAPRNAEAERPASPGPADAPRAAARRRRPTRERPPVARRRPRAAARRARPLQ